MGETPATIGRYLVEGMLGQGAMGVVYRARDPAIERPVAVKLVRVDLLKGEQRETYLARFRQEVQAAGRCQHPNIVTVYDYGVHDGAPFFVMEHVEGRPLDEALPRETGMGPQAAGAILLQLLGALECAHGQGVTHRDIKPANLMLMADRRIKVMDFGISGLPSSQLTQAGTVMGTPDYMAPEQIRGEAADARSDIHAAGVVLHELLTGRTPYDGAPLHEVMARLVSPDPPKLAPAGPLMPEPLRAVVARAMAKAPADRFASAAAMAQALRSALEGAAARAGAQATVIAPARTVVMPAERRPSLPEQAEAMAGVQRRLAEHLGPIAGRVLRDALKDAASVEDVCARLSSNLDGVRAREDILREVRATLLRPPPSETPAEAPEAPRAAALSEDELARVRGELARYVGPIASVLVKRAAPQAASMADLRRRLAENLDDPADRAAFTTGL
ncbi:MAG TPA: serine/threonine-protein kinase [Caulobacteraceae bacterium]|jgi:serine/threonine-protein kinase